MSLESTQAVILLGAGGHARVVLATASALGWRVHGVCDPELARQGRSHWNDLPVLGDDQILETLPKASFSLLNGIGLTVGSQVRRRVFERWRGAGFHFPCLVHPCAWVAPDVSLGEGCQVMAGAIVQPGGSVGENVIINTRASIDHDGCVEDHAHVAPGVTACGGVRIGRGAFVGAGAVLLPGSVIGDGAVLGAGALLSGRLDQGQLMRADRSSRIEPVRPPSPPIPAP